jgi:hypothetical protein
VRVNGGQAARRGRDGGAARMDAAATSNSPGTRWRDSVHRRRGRDAQSLQATSGRQGDRAARGRSGGEQLASQMRGRRWICGPHRWKRGARSNEKTAVSLILVPCRHRFSIEKRFPSLFFSFFINFLAVSSNCLYGSFINAIETILLEALGLLAS